MNSLKYLPLMLATACSSPDLDVAEAGKSLREIAEAVRKERSVSEIPCEQVREEVGLNILGITAMMTVTGALESPSQRGAIDVVCIGERMKAGTVGLAFSTSLETRRVESFAYGPFGDVALPVATVRNDFDSFREREESEGIFRGLIFQEAAKGNFGHSSPRE